MGLSRPVTIGRIDFANAWPLFQGWERFSGALSYEVVSRVPSELNRLLYNGELDVSAISSFSYGQFADRYVLLPHLSVGSVGNVHSLLLFLKEPIEVKRPKRIAVSAASATTVNLLKIIMALYYECEPEYITVEPDLDHMMEIADAAMLIGDPAIQASWRKHGYTSIDLGGLWNKWTGHGMTYAVVAARREVAAMVSDTIRDVYEALQASKLYNKNHPELLIDQACRQMGGDSAFWEMYFQTLQYDFGDKLQSGLDLYFKYANQLGLLKREVELAFFEVQSVQKVNE